MVLYLIINMFLYSADIYQLYIYTYIPYIYTISTQLLEVLDKWTDILDRGGDVDVVYLDLAKSFDSVPHNGLLLWSPYVIGQGRPLYYAL